MKTKSKHYKPVERPTRYPLELTEELHICLWDVENKYKFTIAYFVKGQEDYSLRFVGDRPLLDRVDWLHFKELVEQGSKIAARKFNDEMNKTEFNVPF